MTKCNFALRNYQKWSPSFHWLLYIIFPDEVMRSRGFHRKGRDLSRAGSCAVRTFRFRWNDDDRNPERIIFSGAMQGLCNGRHVTYIWSRLTALIVLTRSMSLPLLSAFTPQHFLDTSVCWQHHGEQRDVSTQVVYSAAAERSSGGNPRGGGENRRVGFVRSPRSPTERRSRASHAGLCAPNIRFVTLSSCSLRKLRAAMGTISFFTLLSRNHEIIISLSQDNSLSSCDSRICSHITGR